MRMTYRWHRSVWASCRRYERSATFVGWVVVPPSVFEVSIRNINIWKAGDYPLRAFFGRSDDSMRREKTRRQGETVSIGLAVCPSPNRNVKCVGKMALEDCSPLIYIYTTLERVCRFHSMTVRHGRRDCSIVTRSVPSPSHLKS